MSKKRPAFSGNPDLRRGMQVPGPPIAEIEAKLLCWLTPESFKPLRLTTGEKKLHDRILTLPAIMAVVLSLVYRRISGLSEVVRVLESEGLLWLEPLKVSKQALSKRLAVLPTELFGQIFEQIMVKVQSRGDKLPIPIGWESVYQNFSALWIADGSTLEALRKKLKASEDSTMGLGGRMMMIVEAFNHQPVATLTKPYSYRKTDSVSSSFGQAATTPVSEQATQALLRTALLGATPTGNERVSFRPQGQISVAAAAAS